MKRLLVALAAALTIVLGMSIVGMASAQSFYSGSNADVNQPVTDSSVYAAGNTVTVSNQVNGDIYCAGQTVTVSGTVNGDIICAGQTVTVSGKINGNIRVAGQTVNLLGDVSGNATVIAQSFVLDSNAKIGGDLTLGNAMANLNGSVGRDVVAGSGSLTIAGNVGRNVKTSTDDLHLTSTAHIGGNVDYTSSNLLTKDNGATVGGAVNQTIPKQQKDNGPNLLVIGTGIKLAFVIYAFFAMFFTAMILVLIMPRFFDNASSRAMPRPWKALLVGLVAQIVVPPVLFLIAVTIIGIPLAILGGLVWLVIMLLCGPVAAYYFGRLMLRGSTNALLIMLVGSAVLLVLLFVPIIGIFVLAATVWIGVGSLLLELHAHMPKPQYNLAKRPVKAKN